MNSFNKRWNIADDFSDEEEFQKLKIRINNIIKKFEIDKRVHILGVDYFCNEIWIETKSNELVSGLDWYSYYDWKNIEDFFLWVKNIQELAKWLEILSETPSKENISWIIDRINESAIIKSKIINWKIFLDWSILTYPSWEKILDEEVVNNVLSFLGGVPWEHFISALKSLWTWQSLEALRKTLEEFLRLKLENDKNYENNINELWKILKSRSTEAVLQKIIINQLKSLEWYFNESSKHKTRTISISENEHILYWVANVLKIINEII